MIRLVITYKDFKIDEFGQKEDCFEIHDIEYVNKTDGEIEMGFWISKYRDKNLISI